MLVILPKQICLNKTGQIILPKQNGILKALIIKQVKILLRQNAYFLGSVTSDKSHFIRSCTFRFALSILSHDLRI